MQVPCLHCHAALDLFPSWVIARNAYPDRKPEVQVLCPSCGDIFPGLHGQDRATCRSCGTEFDPGAGPAKGAKAACPHCGESFTIIDAVASHGSRPGFRLYGKLVLTRGGVKEYLPATADDQAAYRECSARLRQEMPSAARSCCRPWPWRTATTRARPWLQLPHLAGLLQRPAAPGPGMAPARHRTDCRTSRRGPALLTLFSGVLEFNNLFASYKGEGTGAVRHMFSHHILKPERTPIEANVWGTPKSSGSFSNLFRGRLLRAIDYRLAPTEVNGTGTTGKSRVCAPPFSGRIAETWPSRRPVAGAGDLPLVRRLGRDRSARTGALT